MTRAVVLVLTLSLAGLQLPAQTVGDSVRFQDADATWQYGRVLTMRPESLTVRQAGNSVVVPYAPLRRLDRWERVNASGAIIGGTALGLTLGVLAYALTPKSQRIWSATTYDLVGAGCGLAGGGLAVAIMGGGRWRIMINR